MNIKYNFIIIIVIIFIIFKMINKTENMADISTVNNEALQTIASVYNSNSELTVPKLHVMDKLKSEYSIEFGDNNKWTIKAPQDQQILKFIPNNGDETKAIIFDQTGNVTINGNLTVNGESNLSNWRIKNDRIGIKDRADLTLASDKWLRNISWEGDITSGYNPSVGFAGNALWTNGTVTTENINVWNNMVARNNYVRRTDWDVGGCDIVDFPFDKNDDFGCLAECKRRNPETVHATLDTEHGKCYCKREGCGQGGPASWRVTRSVYG
jgi:hypothetical protein